MKAMYLLFAAALVSASAMAQPQFQGAVSRHINLSGNASKMEMPVIEANRPVEMHLNANVSANRLVAKGESRQAVRQNAKRAKAATFGAYYNFGDGTLKSSLVWDGGFWGYNNAIANAFPYTAKFNAALGNAWSMITPQETYDLSEYADSDNNITLSDFGIGAYYMPTITNGKASYIWSTVDTQSQILNQGWYTGLAMGVFDAFEASGFYRNINDGYGYGSTTGFGPSHTLVDIGQVGGPLVVEDVSLWLTTATQLFATDDDYILVKLYDTNGDDVKTYEAYIRAENIETSTNGSMCGIGKFVEIDEDGFESEVSPVLTGDVQIIIDGTEGTDYCILSAVSDVEDEDADGYPYYESRTSFWSDGSAPGMGERYYSWFGIDAVVILNAHFNALTTYGTAEREAYGYVPNDATYYDSEDGTKYALAVAGVDEEIGAYNNFRVESSFGAEAIEVEFDPDVVLACECDTAGYFQTSIISVFVAVKELPQDVDVRTTTVTLTSMEEAEYKINITQFGAGAGINTVAKDAEKEDNEIYNLQGVKVSKSEADLPAGVYVKNGKKFVK